jgi:hypothetical protein
LPGFQSGINRLSVQGLETATPLSDDALGVAAVVPGPVILLILLQVKVAFEKK